MTIAPRPPPIEIMGFNIMSSLVLVLKLKFLKEMSENEGGGESGGHHETVYDSTHAAACLHAALPALPSSAPAQPPSSKDCQKKIKGSPSSSSPRPRTDTWIEEEAVSPVLETG